MSHQQSLDIDFSVVIHAEEEFDWRKGFFQKNTDISHAKPLIAFSERLLEHGSKLTFALDYSFLREAEGLDVVKHFKKFEQSDIEFAAHLHPWVTPPFSNKGEEISEYESYPGNLGRQQEYEKLAYLTDKMASLIGYRPTTYVAGRYGIGANTHSILKELEYDVDLSLSPFFNSEFQDKLPYIKRDTNLTTVFDGITYVPHSSGCLSYHQKFSSLLNRQPHTFTRLNSSYGGKILLRTMGVELARLSPEGVNLDKLKRLTHSLIDTGVTKLVFSFHSPSVAMGNTPYVNNDEDLKSFEDKTNNYLDWLINEVGAKPKLPREWAKS